MVACQELSSHSWLVATVLDNANMEYFFHHRKFYWTEMLSKMSEEEENTTPLFLRSINFTVFFK